MKLKWRHNLWILRRSQSSLLFYRQMSLKWQAEYSSMTSQIHRFPHHRLWTTLESSHTHLNVLIWILQMTLWESTPSLSVLLTTCQLNQHHLQLHLYINKIVSLYCNHNCLWSRILHHSIRWLIELILTQWKRRRSNIILTSRPPLCQKLHHIAARAIIVREEREEIEKLATSWAILNRAWTSSQNY